MMAFFPDLDTFRQKFDKGFRFDQVQHRSHVGCAPENNFPDKDEMKRLKEWSETLVNSTYDFEAFQSKKKRHRGQAQAQAPKTLRKPQLNKTQIEEVLVLLGQGLRCEDIAKTYCCSSSTIRRVRRLHKFKSPV